MMTPEQMVDYIKAGYKALASEGVEAIANLARKIGANDKMIECVAMLAGVLFGFMVIALLALALLPLVSIGLSRRTYKAARKFYEAHIA